MSKILPTLLLILSFIFLFSIVNLLFEPSQSPNNITNNDISPLNSININSFSSQKPILVTTNKYRFKNSIDDVTLSFEEIYIISEWNNIKPHNDYFLIMKVSATSNTPSDSFYHFPFIISDSNQKQYISINNTFNYNYEDSKNNIIDISTEINLDYLKKENDKIRAYNTNIVSGGNGTRFLVFDISKETAEDPQIYFIFHGTTDKKYENDVSPKNVYFFNYIEHR